MTSVTDVGMASSRLHISATLTVFIEVPKEVEPNRCNQGSQSAHSKHRAVSVSRVSDPNAASPARCKERTAHTRLFFSPFFFTTGGKHKEEA